MIRLRNRLARENSETGLSLIEVIVAMFIFALVATGVAYSMIAIVKMTSDARDRQTATNLAASAIDAARETANVVTFTGSTVTQTVDGITYKIVTDTAWQQAGTGAAGQCTSGSGALLDKSVNVNVTWGGQTFQNPVQADTVIAPVSRVNDTDKGAIIVAVTTASGEGNTGVTITATPASPANGATAITSTISPTDSDGCGVILNVVPGNYNVKINETTTPVSVDNNQNVSPNVTQLVTVTAGTAVSAPFDYDQSVAFTPVYHSNYVLGTVTMPTGMDTSFVNTYGIATSTSSGPFNLFPWSAGYQGIAGKLAPNGSTAVACLSVDPAAWPTSSDGTLVGARQPAAAAAPGGSAIVNIPMGVFNISGLSGKYLLATSQTTGPSGTSDPGCATTTSYVIAIPSGSSAQVALPFGSWAFKSGTSATLGTQTTSVNMSNITALTRGSINGSILTLDPRTAP